MAQLTVRINGYAYTVGCEDGQEPHLRAMAAELEKRIEQIKALGGQSGENQMLVLAGLLMADELHDQALARASAPAPNPAAAPAGDDPALRALAQRAEDIAAAFERD